MIIPLIGRLLHRPAFLTGPRAGFDRLVVFSAAEEAVWETQLPSILFGNVFFMNISMNLFGWWFHRFFLECGMFHSKLGLLNGNIA